MNSPASPTLSTAADAAPVRQRLARGIRRERRFVLFAAFLLAAALSPGTYRRPVRQAVAQAVCFSAGQALPGYALFSILFGAVTTHIVAVSAASYGLSHLAMEAVVRVFVVELIPLAAALFVAMRSGIAVLDRLAAQRAQGAAFEAGDLFERCALPGFIGNLFAVILLTLVSSVLVLCVSYLVIHGLTPWGITGFTRLVGQVFDPVTAPGFLLKIALFGMAVGVAPATVALDAPRHAAAGSEMRVMARLFLLLVAVEGASLVLLHF
jgi:phospholipid/cholesterol/gamma-HCH transport system permease protein